MAFNIALAVGTLRDDTLAEGQAHGLCADGATECDSSLLKSVVAMERQDLFVIPPPRPTPATDIDEAVNRPGGRERWR